MRSRVGPAIAAWLLASSFYFYQYTLRSSPSVMLPELSKELGLSAAAVASLLGVFYYGYAAFSLIAGPLLDRFGTKVVVPLGALITGAGCLLFATGDAALSNLGRFLQGAGGSFALLGALYIVTQNFQASKTATMTGTTQMFGSSGASAGQFLIGPLIAGGVALGLFWTTMGGIGIAIALVLFVLLPKVELSADSEGWLKSAAHALGAVLKNPQSYICGFIAGLMFIPTTILDMIWGVKFLQEAHGFDYGEAVIRSTTVPAGWLIGCPLWGYISDRIGRRKPAIIAACLILMGCVAWILYGRPIFPPYVVGLLMGIASGAAMLTYTVIKEVNQPQFGGTATGVVGFLNFALSAVLGPVFGWIMARVSGEGTTHLERYQTTFQPLLYGIVLAIVLTWVFLRETGPAVRTEEDRAKAA